MSRGARDRGEVGVEVEQGGRPRSFDGNHTSDLDSWYVVPEGTDVDDIETFHLMRLTVLGHLSWCLFPVDTD